MALTNMQVYNDEIVGNTIELLGQKIDMFNAASGGSILLNAATFRGDFSKESFFNQIASAQRRVDRYATNAVQAATSLAQGEMVGVKVAGGFGPLLFEPAQMTYLQQDPGAAITAIATGFADALLADQLNTAVGCGVAAVENIAALTNDVSGAAGVTQGGLNNSHRLFGDMSSILAADVMTGDVYHRLVAEAITNGNRLFLSTNVQVVDILGKTIIISDIPALFEAGTPNKDKVLSVTAGGIIVDNSSDIVSNMETTNGNQRIETTWQADYTFGVKLKGYAWDIANGGASPTDAELFTGTNWDKAVAENKHTLGTLLVGSADV
tara:strand:+ start:762 stop:1730 length:969 start_codon:yes stop_codon:yes gene_type:complete